MIPKINGLGRSFAGVAAYCLHDAPEPDDRRPETSERVGWTDTRNLATVRPERAARLMAATAKAAPDLKRLAGGAQGGRKLAKPVLHYSLSWARDETPDRREMSRAVDGSLEALGLEHHEALIVAHEDTRHPHVHVIANRVDPATGKAAKLGNSKLRLSRWAEGFEREQGRIRCEERVKNNARRRAGQEVVRNPWERPLHWARYRREGMLPRRARRARGPVDEKRVDMEAWRRAEAQAWEKVEDGRWLGFWRLETQARKEWAELHKRQEDTRQRLDRESRTVRGRLRIWGVERSLRELVGAIRGRGDLVEGWREELDRYHKHERAALGKAHGESAREIERKVRENYGRGLRDAERWAREMRDREGTRARGPSITRIVPQQPRPRGPDRGGERFER
ncbi:relaxase/mobilization nuclease domain-containing protein [Candidatus Palauibacter polyketidifaciens]|uniref:relaxase/mobilization nuclease domain-containing protein n=1 Tax=Candidatus Palauibacter polyketidifaciens TaxID=3056740 RepID=UPI002392AD06|nr:relaxase/mobilization nuclease domain-containing protein [Candidatus Palauibacter polyketidifaciens]MDE2720554.1 relaxase/mobilization nuclease domain-containing protein [Candidatus Palauibacter polyketidifaciens]